MQSPCDETIPRLTSPSTLPTRTILPVLLTAFTAISGCREQAMPASQPPRPVSYVTLQMSNPSQSSRLTGTAESWKREDLGFEVAGRVQRVVEPGANIVGKTYDENGQVLTEGTVLAEIDDERYQIALRTAQAAAGAAKTELETVIPEQLNQAQAALDLANTDVTRFRNLVRDKAAPKQRLDQAEAAQKTAQAQVAGIEALRATKSVTIEKLNTQVEQAKIDIQDCKLRSPFTGQVARVHVIPGGYALPGQAVVTVQMMDPMKVNIAVSARTDERINQNDLIRVFAPDGEELEGMVYLKDTYADPATRTFLVTLLVRNRRILIGVPDELRDQNVAQCRNIWKLDQPVVGSDDNYYTEVKTIQKDAEGHFVWKVENLTRAQLYEDFDPVLTVKKVRVTLGEGRVPLLQVFTFRELTDIGELDPATDVIAGDITGEVKDGGKIVLVRERWLGRPGDVVRVALKGKETPAGFYVPQAAIQFDGQKHFVAVAEPGEDAYQVVHVPVTPAETVGQLQRIVADGDAVLQVGMKVIVDGAHYVTPQNKVNPVDEIEVQP